MPHELDIHFWIRRADSDLGTLGLDLIPRPAEIFLLSWPRYPFVSRQQI